MLLGWWEGLGVDICYLGDALDSVKFVAQVLETKKTKCSGFVLVPRAVGPNPGHLYFAVLVLSWIPEHYYIFSSFQD